MRLYYLTKEIKALSDKNARECRVKRTVQDYGNSNDRKVSNAVRKLGLKKQRKIAFLMNKNVRRKRVGENYINRKVSIAVRKSSKINEEEGK